MRLPGSSASRNTCVPKKTAFWEEKRPLCGENMLARSADFPHPSSLDRINPRPQTRAAFSAQADRIGLGLTGNVPHDLQKFITLAHNSYVNAKQDPWTTKLTKRNYAKARLDTLNADLTALSGTESASNIAAGAAEEDTTARDLAYTDLKDWIKEAHGVARGAFRKNVGALTKLKL